MKDNLSAIQPPTLLAYFPPDETDLYVFSCSKKLKRFGSHLLELLKSILQNHLSVRIA